MVSLSYCIAAPIKQHTKELDTWIEHLKNFKPPPDEIILSSENDFPSREDVTFLKVENLYIPKEFVGKEGERCYRIGLARETIRRYISDNTKHAFTFWLDSDVYCMNEYTPLIFAGLVNLTSCSVLVNEITSTSGYPSLISLGCVFMSRNILQLSCFMPYGNFSEDSLFYVTLNNLLALGYDFKIVYGRIVPVKHIREGKEMEIPPPDLDLKVIQRQK